MSSALIAIYISIGVSAGVASGIFGIGGGIIIVPALVYLAGFSQLSATGTSLAILLPPIGLAAVIEYYRHGYVNFPAAMIIALSLFFSAWITSRFTVKMNPQIVKLIFGVFLVCLGFYTVFSVLLKNK